MATLKKYNLKGEEAGTLEITDSIANAEANSQMVKDYIVALRKNARQWSANTKGRSEVKATGRKPHSQKKQGRARQGSIVAPQYRGGGIVFGPKPKFDQHVRINQKERRSAVKSLLAEKIQAESMLVISETEMEAPKTKVMADFLSTVGLKGSVLFVGEGSFQDVQVENVVKQVSVKSDQFKNLKMSLSNLPKVHFSLAANLSGYDVLVHKHIVLTEGAVKELEALMQ